MSINGLGELLAIGLYPVLLVLMGFALYWIVRLGVRHGIRDAETRAPRAAATPPPRAPSP